MLAFCTHFIGKVFIGFIIKDNKLDIKLKKGF